MAKNSDRSGIEVAIRQKHPPDAFQSGDRIIRTIHDVPLRVVEYRLTPGAATSVSDPAIAGRGDSNFIGWTLRFRNNPVGTSNLVRGESSLITASTDAGVLTCGSFSGNIIQYDEFDLLPPWAVPEVWTHLTNAITYAAGTTGAAATRELFTVTGSVKVKLMARCTTACASAGNPALSLGTASNTSLFISDTDVAIAGADGLDAGELWYKATAHPTSAPTADAIMEAVITNGDDIGTDNTGGGTITGGVIAYDLWWQSITDGSSVVTAAGTGTL